MHGMEFLVLSKGKEQYIGLRSRSLWMVSKSFWLLFPTCSTIVFTHSQTATSFQGMQLKHFHSLRSSQHPRLTSRQQ